MIAVRRRLSVVAACVALLAIAPSLARAQSTMPQYRFGSRGGATVLMAIAAGGGFWMLSVPVLGFWGDRLELGNAFSAGVAVVSAVGVGVVTYFAADTQTRQDVLMMAGLLGTTLFPVAAATAFAIRGCHGRCSKWIVALPSVLSVAGGLITAAATAL